METEDSEPNPTKTPAARHRCSACFKQYKKKEHLVAHMKNSYHSVHEPRCGVCQKHCKSFESLREHLTGPLSKRDCSMAFADRGCGLCLKVFKSSDALSKHKETCSLPAPAPLGVTTIMPSTTPQIDIIQSTDGILGTGTLEAVALDCEMVGGGDDGSLDICARVCLIDEDENVIFHTYIKPEIPVTNYRFEITGISEKHLGNAMPLTEVGEKIYEILYNGESIGRLRLDGGNAKVLVGHNLEHDLDCLNIYYPDHMLRDTAKYRPLLKTNFVSHSLKYLTRTYLGNDIQTGLHDPYEDSVSAMRLYKRMRALDHPADGIRQSIAFHHTQTFTNRFNGWTATQLEEMSPDELFEISRSNYRCWCLDSKKV